ncbi:hypothetical protein [Glycomyces tarimensis]
MSDPNDFQPDEIRAAARRIQALPEETDTLPDRIADAVHRVAAANPGFASARRLAVVADGYRESIVAVGQSLSDQADSIIRAADARESGDEATAAEFDRLDPPA